MWLLTIIVAGAIVALGIYSYWEETRKQEEETRKQEQRNLLLVEQGKLIHSTSLKFENFTAGWYSGYSKIQGRVINNSKHTLTGFNLHVYFVDGNADRDLIIGEDPHVWFSSDIPPGQARDVEGDLNPPKAFKPNSGVVWSYKITEIRGEWFP